MGHNPRPISVGFLTLNQVTGITAGSSVLRADNLIKYWPEAELADHNKRYDVLILQKVYNPEIAKAFTGLVILDLCDPDFDVPLFEETVRAADVITCSSLNLYREMHTRTSNPVYFLDDRHDPEVVTRKKKQKNAIPKMACWFGFSSNFALLKEWAPLMRYHNLKLRVIADKDPGPQYRDQFYDFSWETLPALVTTCDLVINPKLHRYKSTNKTTLSWMMGMPVITNRTELSEFMGGGWYYVPEDTSQFHVQVSVKELQDIISTHYDKETKEVLIP